jgi:hypothetical protein
MKPIRNDKRVQISLSLISALLIPSFVSQAFAAAPMCVDVVKVPAPAVPAANLDQQLAAHYPSENIKAYADLVFIRGRLTELEAQSPILMNGIKEILQDEELSTFHMTLKFALQKIRAQLETNQLVRNADGTFSAPGQPGISQADTFKQHLKTGLLEALSKIMSPAEAAKRVALLDADVLTKFQMMRALGNMNADESLRQLIGEDANLEQIAPDSLVGRFLSQSQAAGVTPSTFVGTFHTEPGLQSPRGERRLYVAVDARNVKIAQEMFMMNPNLLSHYHTQGQGTLNLMHTGKQITYAQYLQPQNAGFTEVRGAVHVTGNIAIPMIVLSSTEASRATNYFTLGTITSKARSKFPWSLQDMSDGVPAEKRPYCRTGAYQSCTHWVGEMAIGDKLVPEYKFPGDNNDDGPGAKDPFATDQKLFRTGPVGKYTHFTKPDGRQELIGTDTHMDRLTRIVWTQNQGHEQLWSLLNGEQKLKRGEFANPGWVFYSLIGTTPTERVPVVLLYRPDASQPLTDEIITQYQASVSAH